MTILVFVFWFAGLSCWMSNEFLLVAYNLRKLPFKTVIAVFDSFEILNVAVKVGERNSTTLRSELQ
jgi:hypothetical protein